jgi:signal transduction histidine kinase
MRYLLILLFSFFLFALFPFCGYGIVDTLRIVDQNRVLEVGSGARYYLDTTGTLTIEDIIKTPMKSSFASQKAHVPIFNNKKGRVWFTFELLNELDEAVYLQLSNIFILKLDLYVVDSVGVHLVKSTGFLRKFSARDMPVSQYVIRIPPTARGGTSTLIGSLYAEGFPSWTPLKIGSASALVAASRSSEFISIGVIAVMLVMFLYNLSICILLRDRLYAAYLVYLFSSICYVLFSSGFWFEWFWPNNPIWNLSRWPVGVFLMGLPIFINAFLGVQQYMPRFYKISYIIYFLSAAIILIGLFDDYFPKESTLWLINLTSTTLTTYAVCCSAYLTYRKTPTVFLFLVGWVPVMLVSMAYVPIVNGFYYNEFIKDHGFELAIAWEIVVFSLALGHRYNLMRQEKLKVQAENLQLVLDQNRTLESKVKERTEEIIAQNEELVMQQEEIKAQRDLLEEQKLKLEESQAIISEHNKELSSAVVARTMELAQSNEELKGQYQQLEQYSFITAHNLRGPVASILGLTSLFDKQNLANPENRQVIEKLMSSTHRLDEVIHDMATILEAKSSKSVDAEEIFTVALKEKITNLFFNELKESSASIEWRVGTEVIIVPKIYLESILLNLISNALKYRDQNRSLRIIITINKEGAGYVLKVEDNGIGFNIARQHHKVFQPFQRFHTGFAGKGLGLYLVKTHVTAIKGSIHIESREHEGTTVEILIPSP